jgi:hypothetical protein
VNGTPQLRDWDLNQTLQWSDYPGIFHQSLRLLFKPSQLKYYDTGNLKNRKKNRKKADSWMNDSTRMIHIYEHRNKERRMYLARMRL